MGQFLFLDNGIDMKKSTVTFENRLVSNQKIDFHIRQTVLCDL